MSPPDPFPRIPDILSSLLQRWLPLLVITSFAFWLRAHDLSRRPMHADEANQGVKAGELIEQGRYAFDPHDHHGPTLYYAAVPLAWLRGERTLAALDEVTLRLVPALAGTAAVLLLGVFLLTVGRVPLGAGRKGQATATVAPAFGGLAYFAAAFLAVSPPAVYYSRYYIQETLLVAFTLGLLVSAVRWWRSGQPGWAVTAGVAFGLMSSTKASAGLFILAALAGAIALRPRPLVPLAYRRDGFLAVAASGLVMVIFYSSFGTHPAGLRDMLAVFGPASGRIVGASGHEKPWWYYLSLFGWQRNGGLVWEQVLFSTLALTGLGLAVITRRPLLLGAAIYTGIVGLALSLVPYKTPWHAIHLVPGLAVLAAGALDGLGRLRTGKYLAAAIGFLCLGSLMQQTWRAAFLRPADGRNPYAYVHSSHDVRKFRDLVEAALMRHDELPVLVIGEEYWPLPWYFRGLPRIGYWREAPVECDGALIIVEARQVEVVKARLRGAYQESILGLRPGVIVVLFTRGS